MPQVSSSAIRRITYDDETATLFVLFASGRLYAYRDVPVAVKDALLSAPSHGAAFNALVRDRYPFTDMTD